MPFADFLNFGAGDFSPLFVSGSCFWFCIPPPPPPLPPPPPPPRPPSFNLCHSCRTLSFTHILVNHHLSHTSWSHTIFLTHHLSHTALSHTICHTPLCHTLSVTHTHLCHTPSFTHNFVTHTTLSPTIFHTQLCHTPSFTHIFVNHHLSHTTLSQLCHTPSFTHNFVTHHLSHTTLLPTIFAWQAWHLATSTFVLRGRRGTWRHAPSFCVAGLALMALGWLWWRAWAGIGRRWRRGTLRGRCGAWRDIHLRFTWQAWHLWPWGSGGALGLGLVAGDAAALCVAGVALGDIHLLFMWQAWRLETSTFVLRGRRGAYGTGLALVACLGWDWSPVTPRHFGRGTWRHPPSFHVAGVALGDIHLRFAWQAWRLWHWAGSGGVLGPGIGRRWRSGTLRGWRGTRRGTWRHLPSFCVAGVALMALGWLWWRAWAGIGRRWRRGTLRGRRGTWRHPP